MKLHIQKCAEKHLDTLVRISRNTFVDAFQAANNPADFKNYVESSFSEDNLRLELKHPDSFFYFVYNEKELVCYFKLNVLEAQTDVFAKNTIELERIYVIKEFQGQRIGQWILEEIKMIARKKSKDCIWLGVWEQNTAAIRFYNKNGFIKFGTHPYYIGKDKQTDWLMRLDLTTLEG